MSLPQNFLKLYERRTNKVVVKPSTSLESSHAAANSAFTDSQSDKFTNNSSDQRKKQASVNKNIGNKFGRRMARHMPNTQ
jgi:hypothetical protein